MITMIRSLPRPRMGQAPKVEEDLGLPPNVAMDVMQRARELPECARSQQALDQSHQQLDRVNAQQVDIKACINRSVSEWGCFALCGSMFGSMYILSKSGLTGTGAMVGLAVGFIGVPALAMWLVKKNGEAKAKAQLDDLARQRQLWQGEVQKHQQALSVSMRAAVERLYKEAQTREKEMAPDAAARVSTTDTTVQLGKIKVVRRGSEEA